MADTYRIIEVNPEWKDGDEDLGSKEKFWYFDPECQTRWLFKYPQDGVGQHWAEKIAERIASVLEIKHAKVELARFQRTRGSATESFYPDIVGSGKAKLFHGNQVLEEKLDKYDANQRFHQSQHTVDNIWLAMEKVFLNKDTQEAAKLRIAEYMILDAVIGNTDRHHENWGLLAIRRQKNIWEGFVAPSFDHASSLGRELQDENRARILAENRIEHYVQKGRGGIYLSQNQKRAPSPLNLVLDATPKWPEIFIPALAKLDNLDEHSLDDLLTPIPPNWMTPPARAFAIALMRYSLKKLAGVQQ